MKIKLSKIMAAVTALGVTFAGFTAFATPAVYTTTEYTTDSTGAEVVKVTSAVTDVDVTSGSAEVTYYVSDGSTDDDIIYIDQKTADSNGDVTFEFVTTEARLFKFNYTTLEQNIPTGKVISTVKLGSDSDLVVSDATFTFYPGANSITQADASVTTAENTAIGDYTGTAQVGSDYVYVGQVTGNPAQYGVLIGEEEYPALGCDAQGNFVVVISGETVDSSGTVVKGYWYDTDESVREVEE